ncbi:MAG: hypothetical protein FH756_00315 [Firmicutes bacterium]|nr:hypothetical protein [Bacillota bacterium]
MGIKGRDVFLWWAYAAATLMFLAFALGYRHSLWLWGFLIPCFAFAWFHLVQLPRATKMTKKLGIKTLVLLPIHPKWARVLVGNKIKTGEKGAFEVHLNLNVKGDPFELMKKIDHDLMVVQARFSGYLFIWETEIPVPGQYRKLIQDLSKKEYAFWEKGQWPIPRPPLTGRKTNKQHNRVGAVLNLKAEV